MLSSNGFSITLISMPSIVVMSIRGENFHFSIVIDMHISERCNSRRGSNVYVSSIIVIFAVFCNCRRYSLVDCGNIGGHVYVHYRFSIRWRSLCCVSYSQVLRYTTMTFDLLIVIPEILVDTCMCITDSRSGGDLYVVSVTVKS